MGCPCAPEGADGKRRCRYLLRPRADFDNRWKRKTGFQAPYAIHFILLWLFLILIICVTFGFTLPLVPSFSIMVAVYVITGVLLSLIIGTIISVTSTPTEDRTIRKRAKERHPYAPAPGTPIIDYTGYCRIDRCYVSETTRHCKYCNTCVAKFDHHCLFLNCCISGRNYQGFLILVTLSTLGLALLAATNFYVASQYILDFTQFRDATEAFGVDPFAAMVGLYCVGAVLALVGMVNLYLLIFHVYLLIHGLTTFEYLVYGKYGRGQRPESTGCCGGSKRERRESPRFVD